MEKSMSEVSELPKHSRVISEKLTECCHVLLEILKLYGFNGKGYSIDADVKYYTRICVQKNLHWIKLMKWKLATFSAWAFDSKESPPILLPDDESVNNPFFLGRRAKRFVLHLRSHCVDPLTWQSFVASIAQAKKGFPRASPSDLADAVSQTYSILTSLPLRGTAAVLFLPGEHQTSKQIHPLVDLKYLESQVERTVREIFRDFSPSLLTDTVYTPSMNANYNFTCSDLGTLGMFVEQGIIQDWVKSDDVDFLREVMRRPVVLRLLEVGTEDLSETVLLEMEDFDRLKRVFDELYFKVFHAAMHENPLAAPVPLAEPLKVRVITKGPPLTYFVLKSMQKKIHSHLRTLPIFRLIGETITADVINSVFTQPSRYEQKSQTILSVDYSAATDMIDPSLSEVAVNTICDIFGCEPVAPLRTLFLSAMTRHNLVREKGASASPQRSGQLMGSIVSFPILCIVNAAVMRVVAEVGSNRRFHLSEIKCLINGDDAVLLTNDKGRECWYNVAPVAGLYPSIGKILYNRHLLNMNSTYFSYHAKTGLFRLVPYVNMGLIKGLKRSGGKLGTYDLFDSLSNIGARHRDLYNTAPYWLWDRVHKLFIREHNELLNKISKCVPWYIPEVYGGLGMVGQPSTVDLRAVSYLIASRSNLEHFALLPRKEQLANVSAVALSALPDNLSFSYVHPLKQSLLDEQLVADFEEMFNHLCHWAVYCHPNRVISTRKSTIPLALRHNEKLWRSLLKVSGSKSLDRFTRVLLPSEDPGTVLPDVLIPYVRVPRFFVRYRSSRGDT